MVKRALMLIALAWRKLVLKLDSVQAQKLEKN
jgi:hypothetical protein